MDEAGFVYVNGVKLDEPYITEHSTGITDIRFLVEVTDGKLFVLGDRRATSVDNRSSAVDLIDIENVVGSMLFRVWPLSEFGAAA